MTAFTTPHPDNGLLFKTLHEVNWADWAERVRKQGGTLVAASSVRAFALQRLFSLKAEQMVYWLDDSRAVAAFVALEPGTTIDEPALTALEVRFLRFGLVSSFINMLSATTAPLNRQAGLTFDWRVIDSPVPPSKAVQIKRLLPQIERFLDDGVRHQDILSELNLHGLALTDGTYANTLKRARKSSGQSRTATPPGKALRLPGSSPVPSTASPLKEPKGPLTW